MPLTSSAPCVKTGVPSWKLGASKMAVAFNVRGGAGVGVGDGVDVA